MNQEEEEEYIYFPIFRMLLCRLIGHKWHIYDQGINYTKQVCLRCTRAEGNFEVNLSG